MIKAIVFDWFGVFYLDAHSSLVERFPKFQLILEDLRRQADYGYLDRDEYLKTVSREVGATFEEIEAIITAEHSLNHPLIEYINTSLKPHYKIGLLSNVGRGWMDMFLDRHHLEKEFEAVVLSGDEGVTKPHPQIFELIAERLAVEPEECIMIDDLPENIAGADAAGMKGVVYGTVQDLKAELNQLLSRV